MIRCPGPGKIQEPIGTMVNGLVLPGCCGSLQPLERVGAYHFGPAGVTCQLNNNFIIISSMVNP